MSMPRLDAVIPSRGLPVLLPLAATIALLVSACAPEVITPPAVTVTEVPHTSRVAVPSPPEDPIPEIVWPLTGIGAVGVDQANLDRPSVGIKIENTADGRPQKGLEHADIVFEQYINGSCARLMAFYHSDFPEDVGPIRSVRNMDPNIMGSFDTLLVASGGNIAVQKAFIRLEQLLLGRNFSPTTGYLQRSEGFSKMTRDVVDKAQEFRLWGHPATFSAEAAEKGMGPTPQQFDYVYPASIATAAVEGIDVETIDISYSACAHPHWTWNETDGLWDRFEFKNPHVTMDGNQISATNVIILRVKVAYTQGYNPESFVVVTDAPGYVATGGKIIPIRWTKADQRDGYHLETLDGDPVYLAPGKTWIELAPLSGAQAIAVIKFDGTVQ
ncbi:MAG: DUF3048 domain-containing protein [Demequinaceae bacterium]|nr:DUF3048 domain-containing protein [Demequinaceae bacterium]